MTPQQLADDQLKAQWDLLWWAKPAERLRIINETRKDYEYEDVLRLVTEQIKEAA
jgi:hypothetical protein